MTAQVSDIVWYKGAQLDLAACSDGEPFNPLEYGYKPVMATTACWRGYLCEYRIEKGVLLLHTLRINHQPADEVDPLDGHPPALNGVAATLVNHKNPVGKWSFANVNLHLPYTGGLVIARRLIKSMYIHMGFHPAWKYEDVYELILVGGKVISASNITARMAEVRDRVNAETTNAGNMPTKKDIETWINQCFSRNYNR